MSMAGAPALVAALLAALMAGCERPSPQPVPTPTPTPAAAKQTQSASIIRPDVEVKTAPEPVLSPLRVRIGFDEGGADLSAVAVARLQEALGSDQAKAGGAVTLAGHSDSAGSDEANLAASRKRAEAVRDWLIEHGIAEDRITIVAFGEQNPVAPNALPDGTPDPAGRAQNRRVEVTITPPRTASAPPPGEGTTLVDRLAGEK